jgi:hypothetical protein
MLEWIMKNKEWVFSGIGVAALSVIIGWLRSKRGSGTSGNSVQQVHTGSGDNVAGDKNVNR